TMTLSSLITTAATQVGGTPVEGTALEAETVTIPLTVAAPLSYPTVASSIDFGAVEAQKVELTASLPVTGDGCV
ncbi:hypothetical protein ACMWP8_29090, partial [Escherichia coli]|uniref:hypothetical protein n=1 Tax=Escherichia coli TaxID=562 RepID=UPI0039E0587D